MEMLLVHAVLRRSDEAPARPGVIDVWRDGGMASRGRRAAGREAAPERKGQVLERKTGVREYGDVRPMKASVRGRKADGAGCAGR
ncbi:hypothetical protein GCM10023196_053710 [Actinoallomurus vinaceus]|uniref:Uncharacterized protein n=1 Tax=Actinoallomurus vinaceus TaxID=1080074 RepID=A0ABP8UED0_9ACTN